MKSQWPNGADSLRADWLREKKTPGVWRIQERPIWRMLSI